MKRFLAISLLLLCSLSMKAQTDFSGIARLDKTVHDFGDITVTDGPVSCSYNLTNISKKNITITSVISSCGCTEVKWTRSEIAPRAAGKISATFKNEDGPYPFDKTLTAYVSGIKKPIILHLRGVVRQGKISLDESYPVHFGSLALRSSVIKGGTLSQGEYKSGEITFANIGRKPLCLEFKDVSEGLSLKVEPESLAPGAVGKIKFSIKSDRSRWGRNWYRATPLVNGRAHKSSGKPEGLDELKGTGAIHEDIAEAISEGGNSIGIWAVTKENFSSWSKDKRAQGARMDIKSSTFAYGSIRRGTPIETSFEFSNTGKSSLTLYKVEGGSPGMSVSSSASQIGVGKSGKIRCRIDTSEAPAGENLYVVSVFTNSPFNPVIYLYLTGYIK